MSSKKTPNEDNSLNDSFNFNNEAEANYHFSEWIGAVVYYILRLGKVRFDNVLVKEHHKRNVLTGYLLQVLFVVVLIFVAYKLA